MFLFAIPETMETSADVEQYVLDAVEAAKAAVEAQIKTEQVRDVLEVTKFGM